MCNEEGVVLVGVVRFTPPFSDDRGEVQRPPVSGQGSIRAFVLHRFLRGGLRGGPRRRLALH